MMYSFNAEMVKITKVIEEAHNIKTFVLDKHVGHAPGQFVMISVPGVGECPLTISSYPDIEVTFRKVGNVTDALFEKKAGDFVGFRGPLGDSYPIEEIKGKDVIIVSGGCGLAPMRCLIDYIIRHRCSNLFVFYGAKTPEEILFKKDFEKWKEKFPVYITVSRPDTKWKGHVGYVNDMIEKLDMPKNPLVALCGPPRMIDGLVKLFKKKGVKEHDIILSMERRMSCGLGTCKHCNISNKFVCKDGPNFRYSEIKRYLK